MNKFKLGVLAMAMFVSNAFAVENASANFQAGATLNATCSIKTPVSDIVMKYSLGSPEDGKTNIVGQSLIDLTCTKNTTVSIDLLPNTPYQAGDDPYTNLGVIGGIPRGTFTGTNPENKLAYSIFFGMVNSNPPINHSQPSQSNNFSYTTEFSKQTLQLQIVSRVFSKALAKPDTYKDTVTINITY